MKYEVRLPQLTETMEDGTLVSWFKQVGDWVEKDEKLFEVETDKTAMEVEALDSGFLCEIRVLPEATATVGDVLAVLADSKEEC